MKIATQHAEAVGQRTRIGMEEGLLLDRIALHAADIAPRDVEGSATVVTDLTYTGLPVGDRATMSACVATNTVAIQLLVELTLAHLLIDDFTKSGHGFLGLFYARLLPGFR